MNKSVILFFLSFLSPLSAVSQNIVVSSEVTIPETDVHGIDGADWCSGIATSVNTGNVYWAYINRDREAIIVKKDGTSGNISTHVIQKNIPNDDNHAELSIGLDNAGYIHYIGGQHNNSPNYYRSTNPENISSWEFKGNDLSNGGIDGNQITYQSFYRSNNGTLFCAYRSNLATSWVRGQRSIQLARYNTSAQRWEMLGGLNYCFTGSNCEEKCGSDIQMKTIAWDNSGSGNGSCGGCTGNNHYQGYKFKVVFDAENIMHVTWNVAKNMYTNENPAEYHSHVMYAYSPDEGNTWYRAGGEEITKLPMTCETGDMTQDATIVYKRVPEGYPNDCTTPFSIDQQTMGTQAHIVLDTSGVPIIKQYVIMDDETYYFKLHDTSFIDITSWFSLQNKHLFSNREGIIFDIRGTNLYYSIDNGKSSTKHSLEYPSDWNMYEDQYYLAKTGKLRYYAKDHSLSQARIITLTVWPGAEKPEIAPLGMIFQDSVEVSITCSTSGAIIRYTFDGSEPSKTNGIIYSGPFMIRSDKNIKAVAYTDELNTSNIAEKRYYIIDGCMSKLLVNDVEASGFQDPNIPANTFDENFSTRWSAEGEHWIKYDLGSEKYISYLFISYYNGDARQAKFDVETSLDGETWTEVLGFTLSGGNTTRLEKFPLKLSLGRYVRINCHGTNTSDWNSLTEVEIWGDCENPVIHQYQLDTVTVGEGVIIMDPPGGNYEQATTVTCKAVPTNSKYGFIGWTGTMESTENPISITMTSDKSITANFEVNTYDLLVNVQDSKSGSVQVEPSQPTYEHGTEVLVVAIPAQGYFFESWVGSPVANDTLRLIMEEDISLTANFEQYTGIDVMVSGNAMEIEIYPNPVKIHGEFIVKIKGVEHNSPPIMRIFDITGKLVYSTIMRVDAENIFKCNLGNAIIPRKGIYFVNVSSNMGIANAKLVVN